MGLGRKTAKIPMLRPLIRTVDTRAVRAQPKAVDPFYVSTDYRSWRDAVVARAGRRCEAIEGGQRCPKCEPQHRMFADHIVERQDGGAPLDLANGQCLCGSHHTAKTTAVRTARLRAPAR